jgi:hypothetical protein
MFSKIVVTLFNAESVEKGGHTTRKNFLRIPASEKIEGYRSPSSLSGALLGVHAQLDHSDCDCAADRFLLFGHINSATSALPDLL